MNEWMNGCLKVSLEGPLFTSLTLLLATTSLKIRGKRKLDTCLSTRKALECSGRWAWSLPMEDHLNYISCGGKFLPLWMASITWLGSWAAYMQKGSQAAGWGHGSPILDHRGSGTRASSSCCLDASSGQTVPWTVIQKEPSYLRLFCRVLHCNKKNRKQDILWADLWCCSW